MTKIAVIGSGTMGNGIAHVFAQFGHQVALIDLEQKILEKGIDRISQNLDRQIEKGVVFAEDKEEILEKIQPFTKMDEGARSADIVVEAATENHSIKCEIFKKLDLICPKQTILATNTSSISITKIAAATKRPEKVIGMHFMNPVPVMKLVEIIRGYSTSQETVHQVLALSRNLDKVPVEVDDYPGFVSNRILMPMINEAITTLFEGIAGVEEIDVVMKLGMAHPMGPLQLADFIGLDVCLSILNVLYEGFGQPKYSPCPLLINMVQAGHLGTKSGEGFYKYSIGSKDKTVADRFKSNKQY